MEHLEIFARLKNGEIVCIVSSNIERKQFRGFTFHSRLLEEKHYYFEQIDESWTLVDCNEKLKILQKQYKSLDFYYNYRESRVRNKHQLLTDTLIVTPFLNSHSKKVA